MKVVVTGAAGHLGPAVVQEFSSAGDDVVALTRSDLDITDARAVDARVGSLRPDAIVNCAAYNDVDGAEDEPVAAFAVNAFAVQALARAAARCDAVLVHFSSDFVFDGAASRPYTEEDRPGPLSVYGASKLVGEWLAREAPRLYVLRVESLFGGPTAGATARAGSVGTIVANIEAGREVPVFTDRVVSPTYARDAAAVTRRLLTGAAPPGLYHCVNAGTCRWDELALEAARFLGRDAMLKPLTLNSVDLKARRPRYCALSNAKLASVGIELGHWRDRLRQYITDRAPS
jgi:dTDP-4-dehydrorhamnose reductase